MDELQMYMGEYNHSLDTKGRLFIPAKFRESLGEEFTMAFIPYTEYLQLFSMEKWAEHTASLRGNLTGERKLIAKFVYSNAARLTPDAQGRVVVPPKLRALVGIEKNVTIIGAGDHAEIWPEQKWLDAQTKFSDSVLEQTVEDLGL